MSETWLDPSVQDSEVDIEGYSLIRKDRNRKGGDVCMYISEPRHAKKALSVAVT